jgi:hypothetical protein
MISVFFHHWVQVLFININIVITQICINNNMHAESSTSLFYDAELEGGRNNFFQVPSFEVHKGDLCR